MDNQARTDYKSLLEAFPSPVIVIDAKKNIIDVNELAKRLFHSSDLIGRSCNELFPECEKRDNGCPIDALDYRIQTQLEKIKQNVQIEDLNEEVQTNVLPVQQGDEPLEYVYFHILQDHDLFSRRNLTELEKNMTISTLASGIAHEFNNMNAGIQGIVELMLSQEKINDRSSHDLNTILKIVKRATNLIDQLLIFSYRKPSKKVLTNLESIIDDCIKILRPEMNDSNVSIEVVRKSKIDDMFLDANKVSLAISNILLNSRDAMLYSDNRQLLIESGQVNGSGYVKISDSGSGIEGEHIDRIFEPFFTTKGSLGHSLIPGTGLGLSVANQVIMNHNGTISVESEKDKGTVFTITLPVNTREILEEEIRRNHKDYNFEDIDVLLIDDDQEFNSILERALENKMARVRTSITGAQGLAHLEMEKVDLLVLNMHIPDMNGWDILRQIKYLDKKPRIIVISDNYLSMENEDRALIDYVLMKPFDLEELYSAVRDSLIS